MDIRNYVIIKTHGVFILELELFDEGIYLVMVDGIEVGRVIMRLGDDHLHSIDGHIGYTIYPEYQGHHYSYDACLLLKEKYLSLGYDHVLITCDPDNLASKKIIERLGASFIDRVTIPDSLRKYYTSDEKEKLIYKWRLR